MSFNTLSISMDLEDNGFSQPQAQVLAETIVEASDHQTANLVTKDYLRTDIGEVKTELKTDIAEVRTELKEVKTEITGIKTEITNVRTEMTNFGISMLKWMVGLHVGSLFGTLSLVAGLIYFLLRPFLTQS